MLGTDIAFVDGGGSNDYLESTTTDFTEIDVATNDYVELSGATIAGNSGIFKVNAAPTATKLYVPTNSLTTEAAGDSILAKVIGTDTPTHYITDYRSGYITLYPAPNEAGSLYLSVLRYQLEALTTTTLGSGAYTIPIDIHWQMQLIEGILSTSYLKSGPSTFNYEKSVMHESRFRKAINEAKLQFARLRNPSTNYRPHNGTT